MGDSWRTNPNDPEEAPVANDSRNPSNGRVGAPPPPPPGAAPTDGDEPVTAPEADAPAPDETSGNHTPPAPDEVADAVEPIPEGKGYAQPYDKAVDQAERLRLDAERRDAAARAERVAHEQELVDAAPPAPEVVKPVDPPADDA